MRSVIFKQSLSDKTQETTDEDILARFSRDFVGLKFLSRSDINHSIPKFLGASQSFRFILLEDLGDTHISLVDSLTKSDPDYDSLYRINLVSLFSYRFFSLIPLDQ